MAPILHLAVAVLSLSNCGPRSTMIIRVHSHQPGCVKGSNMEGHLIWLTTMRIEAMTFGMLAQCSVNWDVCGVNLSFQRKYITPRYIKIMTASTTIKDSVPKHHIFVT